MKVLAANGVARALMETGNIEEVQRNVAISLRANKRQRLALAFEEWALLVTNDYLE